MEMAYYNKYYEDIDRFDFLTSVPSCKIEISQWLILRRSKE